MTEDVAVDVPLRQLLGDLGLEASDGGGRVLVTGPEQSDISRLALATASATAHAAYGVAIAALWRDRTRLGQDVSIEAPRAVQALFPHAHTRQHGRRSPFGSITPGASRAIWPARDGRGVLLVLASARPHQLQRTLETLQITSVAQIAGALAERDAFEVEDAIYERNAVAAAVRTPDEWRTHPQGRWLATRPVVEIEKVADGDPIPVGTDRPLRGVRVLDMTHVIAGPTIARLLAEHAADVLHVSPPVSFDPQHFVIDLGVGKHHAIADMNARDDHRRLHELAREADVVVQSFRPDSLERRGLGHEHLAEGHRGLVYVSVSCYGGTSGPWALRRGVDPIAQAVVGIAHQEGGPSGPPVLSRAVTLTDPLAGVLGAAGVAAALRRRAREGGSYHVRVSLARVGMWVQDLGIVDCEPRSDLDASFSHLVEPLTVKMSTPFGPIEYLAPVTRLSRTPPSWSVPPHPHGASPLAWPAPIRDLTTTTEPPAVEP